MALFYVPDIAGSWELPEDEAAHALRVLRLTVGSKLEITDGNGNLYVTEVASIVGKHCYVQPSEPVVKPKNWQGAFHLAIAPTKNMDRIEWLAEKATEVGIDSITFLNCRFSERKVIKTERVERIVVSAMKQSLKYNKPVVCEMTDFNAFVTTERPGAKFIAHCYDSERVLLKDVLPLGEDVTLLVGPEGDFSPEEVELAIKAGYRPVSLGSSRLRTETAGLVGCHTFMLKTEL